MVAQENDTEEIYKSYHHKVRGYIRSRVSNQWESEDLVSEVFLKVHMNLCTYSKEKASVSTWIYTITRNTVVDYFRKKSDAVPLDENIQSIEEIDDDILKEENLEMLAASLARLKEQQRDVIILYYYKGYSLKESAMIMNMSYSNIKLIHQKALKELKHLIEII